MPKYLVTKNKCYVSKLNQNKLIVFFFQIIYSSSIYCYFYKYHHSFRKLLSHIGSKGITISVQIKYSQRIIYVVVSQNILYIKQPPFIHTLRNNQRYLDKAHNCWPKCNKCCICNNNC